MATDRITVDLGFQNAWWLVPAFLFVSILPIGFDRRHRLAKWVIGTRIRVSDGY